MNRETFLSRPTTPKTIDIPLEDGTVIKARKLTQAEVELIRKKYSNDDHALEGHRYIVSRCVLDEHGERMFKDDDHAKLVNVDFDVIQQIAMDVLKFSGLKVPDQKKD